MSMRLTTLCYLERGNCWLMLNRNKKQIDENAGKWIGVGGHIEDSESPDECIIREVREETGLSVQTLKGFREVSNYCPFGKIRKKVVFFLAESFSEEVSIQEEEIDYYIWVTFKEAKNMCCYRNDINVLKKAETIVNKLTNINHNL